MNYLELFNQSYSYSNQNTMIKDKYCGYASLYEIALGCLAIHQTFATSQKSSDKVLEKCFSQFVPFCKNIVYWGCTFDKMFFVKDLVLSSPRQMQAPENKGKIPLGKAGLVLTIQLLLNRVNTATYRALKGMKFVDKSTNVEVKFDDIYELEKKSPTYFEWKGSTSQYHIEFIMGLVNMWRTLTETVVDKVKLAIEESKKVSLEKKQEYVKQKEQEFLRKIEEKKKLLEEKKKLLTEDPKPLIKVNENVPPVTTSVWKKIDDEPQVKDIKQLLSKSSESQQKPQQQKPQQQKPQQQKPQQQKPQHKIQESPQEKGKQKPQQKVEQKESQEESVQKSDLDKVGDREWRDDDNKGGWVVKGKIVDKKNSQQKYKNRKPRPFIMRGSY
jgi:hypothetical protein